LIFTRVGTVLAWVALVLGVMRMLPGLVVMWVENPPPSFVRLLGSDAPGQAVEAGALLLLAAVALGTLTEISRSLRRR
jgi:hypothetical protein